MCRALQLAAVLIVQVPFAEVGSEAAWQQQTAKKASFVKAAAQKK